MRLLEHLWPSCASPTCAKVVMQHVASVLAGCKGLNSSLHAESDQQLQHTMQYTLQHAESAGQQHTMQHAMFA
eukprot:222444-Chlamydomonas_euryale.AAC.1